MDEKTESALTKIIYSAFTFAFLFILINNIKEPWTIVILSGLLLTTLTIRNMLIYPSKKLRHFALASVIFDILIIGCISSLDVSGRSSIFYFVLIADVVMNFTYTTSIMVSVLCYLSYASERYLSLDKPALLGFLPEVAFYSLAFIAITAVMLVVKYEVLQRAKLSQALKELSLKSRQLENTYVKLKKTSEDLEEVTILKERNRIAREVHDTVGHTLTTVLVELEASERLIKKDRDLAVEKIILAKTQVRNGLNDIRQSVRALQSEKELMPLCNSLKLLIDETAKHGEIFIDYEIGMMPKLTEKQEKAVYRALQEGLTNGLKHGNSTAFVFKLKSEGSVLKFLLQDNGKGTDKVIKGFGLSSMEERVKEAGGVMSVCSIINEGFTIDIMLPVNN